MATTNGTKISYQSYYDIINNAEVQRNIYCNIPEIKNVIFNDSATIVFWEDGTKTVVKCQDGDEFDPEKGLAMAIAKKAYGNKGSYCNKMKKWLPKEEQVDTNHIFRTIAVPKEFTFTIDSDKFSKPFKRHLSDAFDIIFKENKQC